MQQVNTQNFIGIKHNDTLDVPADAKLFFVGDIHGHHDHLMKALHKANFDFDKDFLVSVGDLIDRGPDSARVVMLIGERWFHPVMGNHDFFPVVDDYANWMGNGGIWSLEYPDPDSNGLDPILLRKLNSLPLTKTVTYGDLRFGVNHAGIPKFFKFWRDYATQEYIDIPTDWDSIVQMLTEAVNDPLMHRELVMTILWDRTVRKDFDMGLTFPNITGVDYTIHGHTYTADRVNIGNRVYIDTGCGWKSGNLTVTRANADGTFTDFLVPTKE